MIRWLCRIGLVVPLAVLFVAPASAAEAEQSAQTSRKSSDDLLLTPRGHIGLGTPVGFLGVSGELNVIEYLALQLGVGTNGEGPQLAFMGYGRLPVGSDVGLTLGAGVSGGAYRASLEPDRRRPQRRHAVGFGGSFSTASSASRSYRREASRCVQASVWLAC